MFTIQHYNDWKRRRRTFDPAFARRYITYGSVNITLYHTFCSHLNSLVPQLNKVTREHFIDNLRIRADGETVVDLLKEFGNATLEVISMVNEDYHFDLAIV